MRRTRVVIENGTVERLVSSDNERVAPRVNNPAQTTKVWKCGTEGSNHVRQVV